MKFLPLREIDRDKAPHLEEAFNGAVRRQAIPIGQKDRDIHHDQHIGYIGCAP